MSSTSSQLVPSKTKNTNPSSARVAMEANILRASEIVFAEFGYKGATMDRIASQCGISKQNLLYYFSSKELLYRTVLQNIVDIWLERMVFAEQYDATPEQVIEAYIRGKLQLSHDYPNASKVFAQEIISGAPIIRGYLKANLKPLFDRDVQLVQSWVDDGRLRDIEPEHLFIAIWAMTQTYADFAAQIELVLGKNKLEQPDFERATKFLTEMVVQGIVAPK
ncbi:TetR family transcriptional regulator C-terminal domain-containing protein [Vibrio hannami]|uniref:TetR family transcriptional regulator C-terminal domain-containing protein n=1 Tax=Vibrio hannami TaxID=2717094 RepID=UPI00240FB077|nr:TetR family transcriptional regulator C-terminal domain-containing protein [Vibrio hannami]MDG3087770.1 TetR family transcriptional regulator C-terminal domain-containing protein [Vibrio hannami]